MKDDSPAPLDSASAPDRSEAIFHGALQLPIDRRAEYVRQACSEDESLRQRVENLLRANDDAGDFLNAPAAAAQNKTIALEIPLTEKAGDRIGNYKLLQQIGEGGCGVVYMAEQEQPVRRRVALKVIKLGMDTRQVVARFEAERQALAMMDHPNIAKVLDAGATDTGRPFFVMELVRGIKITEYCDQNKLSAEDRLKLFVQICHAIQHAHQKGIIHRDIKPSNILVTVNDGVPVPKVIDFGIAKATEQRLTEKTVFTAFEQFIGTPAYMSPEQAVMTSLDIDTRTDIYSLGVLLYELLTGQTPFDAKKLLASGLDAIRHTIREQEPERPSTRLRTMLYADLTETASHYRTDAPKLIHLLRGDLDWIVMKALEKDRTRRYETANGLAADVQRFLRNDAVEARPPSNFYRFQKLVRRNRAAVTAAAAVVVALALGFGLSLYLYLREAELRVQAERGWSLEKHMRDIAPIAEKLTTAGYFLSMGDFAKAEELMAPLPPIIPASSAIYNVIGDHHAWRKEWAAATTNYLRSIQVNPTNHLAYHLLVPTLLAAEDNEAYETLRQKILQQFSDTTDAIIGERLARDCLLLPASANELAGIAKMTDAALAPGTNPNSWAKLTKGLFEYREGRFESASNWLAQSIAADESPASKLQAQMVLAMTQYRLNHLEAARTGLTNGIAFDDAGGLNHDGISWNDRQTARLLISQAKDLIPGLQPAARP